MSGPSDESFGVPCEGTVERAPPVGEEALLVGTREIAGQSLGYLLVLKRTDRHVYSFEAWGPREAFDAHRAAIEASAKTLAR